MGLNIFSDSIEHRFDGYNKYQLVVNFIPQERYQTISA